MIRTKLRTVAAAAGAAALLAVPAAAGATDATFELTGGGLSMSVPIPETRVDLGSVAVGSLSLSGDLGDVTVTDSRGSLAAAWTARATATDFVHRSAGATPAAQEVVPQASIAYSSGLAGGTGTGTFVPGAIASMDVDETLRVAGTWAGVGVNEQTWNPTLTFVLAPDQVAGSYDGTITHSVN